MIVAGDVDFISTVDMVASFCYYTESYSYVVNCYDSDVIYYNYTDSTDCSGSYDTLTQSHIMKHV